MKHLTFEKARQEITVLNALIRANIVSGETKESNDSAIVTGLKKLIKN